MQRSWIAPVVALVLALFVVSGCGTGFTVGQGVVTVDGLAAGQLVLCGANNEILQITGSGFLSEHGNEVIVEFTALEGAPFNGQPSQQVTGIALSDSLVEAFLPQVVGATELTVTIILPGSNFGVSPPETIQLGGQLVGPFALDDDMNSNTTITTVTGNVTYNAPVPGVLLNDMPAFCGETETEIPEKPRPAPGSASHAILFQGLSVIAPPPGSVNPFDASPGLTTPTMNGGTVVIQADGSFVYEPPLGYEGNDSFTYWMEQPGRPADWATATLTIDKVVWFIRDTAQNPGDAVVGTGRFSDPFDSLQSFNSAQNTPPVLDPFGFLDPIPPNPDDAPQEGDCIFIYDNVLTTRYEDGIRLRDRQQLLGERYGLFLNNTQIVPAGSGPDSAPILANSTAAQFGVSRLPGLPVVTLANENVIRGIDIDGDGGENSFFGAGIFGLDVSGPTLIDWVRICNARDGINIAPLGGLFEVGDPDLPGFPRVEIKDSGGGIVFLGPIFTGMLSAITGGPRLNVLRTEITTTAAAAVNAENCDLLVESCEFDEVGAQTVGNDFGIAFTNFATGATCTCDIIDTAVGRTVESSLQALTIIPFNTGDHIVATVTGCLFRSRSSAVGIGPILCGQDSGTMTLVFDDNTCEALEFFTGGIDDETRRDELSSPTVWVRGNANRETYVLSMDGNTVIGNDITNGWVFDCCTFDADGNPGNGFQQTQAAGTTQSGQSATAGNRVVDTCFFFNDCQGELRFETVNVFQTGGDLSGFEMVGTGVLNLAFTNPPSVSVTP